MKESAGGIVTGLMIVVLLGATTEVNCSERFVRLIRQSAQSADAKEYSQAATLRDSAGVLFQKCFALGTAPRNEMFPFDGVNAFTVAGTLWHAAGQDGHAHAALKNAEQSLHDILSIMPERSLNEQERLYLDRVRTEIGNESAERWGVWR